VLWYLNCRTACDSQEEPFVIKNALPQAIILDIMCVYSDSFPNPIDNLDIGKEGESLEPQIQIASGETAKIGTDGFSSGRIAYIFVITDENDMELFRRKIPRDDLIEHKFKLTITDDGIDFSSE
jgi:hypothetical protein